MRAPRFVVDRAVVQAFASLCPISGARDKCEALAVRGNRLLRLELSLLFVSSFQDDACWNKLCMRKVDQIATGMKRDRLAFVAAHQ